LGQFKIVPSSMQAQITNKIGEEPVTFWHKLVIAVKVEKI